MHLTPEQIDRQPFRMSRRGGYDIVQVRDFLREIAAEMRERQHVRERLVQQGDGDAAVEAQAKAAIADAEVRAAEIIAQAEASAGSAEALESADAKAAQVVAAAQAEADAMVDIAETRAEARSAAVLAAAQVRLDALLAEERNLRRKIDRQGTNETGLPMQGVARTSSAGADRSADPRDRAPIAEQDTSLADFMKTTLRHEVHSD